ncbi:MAG: type I-C CRISPR-associated protein Cas8c/Csd1, partial [bacterium]
NLTSFASLLSKSDSLEVRDFYCNIWGHREPIIQESNFYAVLIAPSRGRFSIYSWHTDTLKNAEEKLKSYFKTITLPLYGEDTMFSISELAGVTVRKPKKGQPAKPLPNTYVSLFETALFSLPLPYKLFKAVLIRQGVELAKGAEEKDFEKRLAGRTAVIKLFFKTTKGEDMEQQKQNVETNPGYLCGRLLAMLDKIHYFAHKESGGTNNSPADRVYSVASKTPALIFPRLCNLARYHLNKIGGGLAYNLEFGIPQEKRKDGVDEDWEGLAEICKRLKDTMTSGFPRILSLEDQGRFAIGFYFERCKNIPETKSKENNNQNVDQNQKEEL